MSIKVMTAVWEHSKAAGTDLLVLLALADNSDDDGYAFPSVAHAARKCKISTSTARRHMRRLQALDELVVIEGGGRTSTPGGTRSNLYRVLVFPPAEGGTGNLPVPSDSARDGMAQAPGDGLAQARAEPSLLTVIEPSLVPASPKRRKQQIPAGFAVTADMSEWCSGQGIRSDPVTETTKFIDHHRSKGSTFADPMAAWRNWMRNADEYTGRTHSRPAAQTSRSMQSAAIAVDLLRAQEAHQDALAR
jgi:hypothetical protein